MALLCSALALAVTLHELGAGDWRPALATRFDLLLALPKVWLRWQRNYLFGAPVIAIIAIAFANHVGFEVFWDIEPS